MELRFHDSGWFNDFEDDGDWPAGWPHDIEYPDGSFDYGEPYVKFKAYDLTNDWNNLEEYEWALCEQGYEFNCEVKLCYVTPALFCEDVIAHFPARDKEEAERLLQVAADALYGVEW